MPSQHAGRVGDGDSNCTGLSSASTLRRMAFSEAPYGELVDNTLRVMTWNVWGRFGPWEQRFPSIVATIREEDPDVVLLQEAWVADCGPNQAELLGAELGYHHIEAGELLFGSWGLANAVLSRWPISEPIVYSLPCLDAGGWGGQALRCLIQTPSRPLLAYCVALDWPPYASAARQHALNYLVKVIAEDTESTRAPLIVGGDFNASPDSDEIRMLVGRKAVPRAGFVLYDAWDYADEGSPGTTWSRTNPWAAPSLLPNQRIDYVFAGRPKRGGVGSVVHARTAGEAPKTGIIASDHYAVVADLRY